MTKKDATCALTLGFLTPYYDFIANFAGFGPAIYKKITDYIKPKDGDKILDVGTGTANLALTIKREYPKVKIVGIDPDAEILEIAKRKIQKEKLDVKLLRAFAQKLPLKSGSFDYVVSSFAIHHIPSSFKNRAFAEMYRVLKSKGTILIIDIGHPKNLFAKIAGTAFSFFEAVGPNLRGFIPKALKETGFHNVKEIESKFGLISFYRAKKDLNHSKNLLWRRARLN